MVKIRLRRIGTKGRPFYRVVVAKSTAGRGGAFVETIGTYDPVTKPTLINIKEDRALYWLMEGAQPTETTAYLLNKVGVLPRFFAERPAAQKKYKFLDKTTAAMTTESVIPTPEAPVAAAVAEAPAAEVVAEPVAAVEVVEEAAPVAEATPEA